MDFFTGCADTTSFRNTDNNRSSSARMIAEVQSEPTSSGIIGRRREPEYFAFTNPFKSTPAAGDQNEARPEHRISDIPNNYRRELGPNGEQIVRDRTGLEVQMVGRVSPQFQKRMLEQIQRLPEADRRQLAAAGTKIVIAGIVVDAAPSIANERPRNWAPGTTQQDADGIYLGDRRTVVVAERTRTGLNHRAEGVLRNGVGHALNDALGNFSNTQDFVRAYQADSSRMNSAQQSRMSFWRQEGNAGRDQTFADVYAALRGGTPNAEETRLLLQAFPRVAELVRMRMARYAR